MSRKILGLDFGSSQSLVSELEIGTSKTPTILQLDGGKEISRTLLAFDCNDDNLLAAGNIVSRTLKDKHCNDSFYVVRNFKRYLGNNMPESSDASEKAGTQAADLCAAYLNYLARRVKAYYDCEDSELSPDNFSTCIAHPSTWSEQQIKLLKQLAQQAGFPDVQTLAEPVAAVFAAVVDNEAQFADMSENYLVIDFGGGTLDICVVETGILGRFPRILSSAGDAELGGKEFDEIIRNMYTRNANFNYPEQSHCNKSYIDEECEKEKIRLSKNIKQGEKGYTCTFDTPRQHDMYIEKEIFANECNDAGILERFIACIRRALSQTDLEPSEIHKVILTGGSSQWWFLREMIASELSIAPDKILLTDKPYADVCRGCAYYAGRANDKELKPGIWVRYRRGKFKTPDEGWSPLQQLRAPAQPGALAAREQKFLFKIEGTENFSSQDIEFKWYEGTSEGTAVESRDEEGQVYDTAIAEIYARSNWPMWERASGMWKASRGRAHIPGKDIYSLYIKMYESTSFCRYELELLNAAATTYRKRLRTKGEEGVKNLSRGKVITVEIEPGKISRCGLLGFGARKMINK